MKWTLTLTMTLVVTACALAGPPERKIDVFVECDEAHLAVGDKAEVRVLARVKGSFARQDDGIATWCLNLRVDPESSLRLVPGSLSNKWTSMGQAEKRLDALLDVVGADLMSPSKGVGGKTLLFTAEAEAVSAGTARLYAQPGQNVSQVGADFLLARTPLDQSSGQVIGDYAGAEATLTVVPEPASLSLLGLGGLAALRRRRR
jgi:hypothetical protein